MNGRWWIAKFALTPSKDAPIDHSNISGELRGVWIFHCRGTRVGVQVVDTNQIIPVNRNSTSGLLLYLGHYQNDIPARVGNLVFTLGLKALVLLGIIDGMITNRK
jgi:hypothetical protein